MPKKKPSTRRAFAYRTSTHSIRVLAPRKVFGRWTIQQSKPRKYRNAAVVVCGPDMRLKILWAKNADEDMRAQIAAVNGALRKLGGTGASGGLKAPGANFCAR